MLISFKRRMKLKGRSRIARFGAMSDFPSGDYL
jgi:hypothetical protein